MTYIQDIRSTWRVSRSLVRKAVGLLRNRLYKRRHYASALAQLPPHPEFIFYIDGQSTDADHVLLWHKHLARLRRPFWVACSTPSLFRRLHQNGINAIICPLAETPKIAASGARAVFYANNSMRNSQMVRFNNLIHIQLLHGESDKPSSFNPVVKMFDQILVAGQLGIDRYHNNLIDIDISRFRIASRPQCEDLQVVREKSDIRTVLYAPTWKGRQLDDPSSITKATEIVSEACRRGNRIIFRPHPRSWTLKDERHHILAAASILHDNIKAGGPEHIVVGDNRFSTKYEALTDCINDSDLLIGDMSSVIADWLYTMKPYILVDMGNDQQRFKESSKLAEGGYYVGSDLAGLEGMLNSIEKQDALWDTRASLREYVLGIAFDQNPIDVFNATVEDILDNFDKKSFDESRIYKYKIL